MGAAAVSPRRRWRREAVPRLTAARLLMPAKPSGLRCQEAVSATDYLDVTLNQRLSPSRLNDFLGCEYRTWLDFERESGRVALDPVPRPDAELLAERGRRREEAFLA